MSDLTLAVGEQSTLTLTQLLANGSQVTINPDGYPTITVGTPSVISATPLQNDYSGTLISGLGSGTSTLTLAGTINAAPFTKSFNITVGGITVLGSFTEPAVYRGPGTI